MYILNSSLAQTVLFLLIPYVEGAETNHFLFVGILGGIIVGSFLAACVGYCRFKQLAKSSPATHIKKVRRQYIANTIEAGIDVEDKAIQAFDEALMPLTSCLSVSTPVNTPFCSKQLENNVQ